MVDFQQEWGNGYLVIFNGKWGNGSMVIIYQEWGKGFVPSVSWEKEKNVSLLHAQSKYLKTKWGDDSPGSCWTGNEETIPSFCWAENEETICWFRHVKPETRRWYPDSWGDDSPEMTKGPPVPMQEMRRYICYPVKQWKWGNGSLVSDDRLWGDDGRPCWQPVTEFSHFPESFVPPPSTTAGTVHSLYISLSC